MIEVFVGSLLFIVLVYVLLVRRCPGCKSAAWDRSAPSTLWVCTSCGVLYDRQEGRWRYQRGARWWVMPGALWARERPKEATSPPEFEGPAFGVSPSPTLVLDDDYNQHADEGRYSLMMPGRLHSID